MQEPQLGTGHAVQQAETALADFSGDVLILYGDVPFVRPATMQAMIARLHAAGRARLWWCSASEPRGCGGNMAGSSPMTSGRITKMVEFKDADAAEDARLQSVQ